MHLFRSQESNSLKIQFTGQQNIEFKHVSQTAIVRPGKYRFEAYIRTEAVSTDQGLDSGSSIRSSPAV